MNDCVSLNTEEQLYVRLIRCVTAGCSWAEWWSPHIIRSFSIIRQLEAEGPTVDTVCVLWTEWLTADKLLEIITFNVSITTLWCSYGIIWFLWSALVNITGLNSMWCFSSSVHCIEARTFRQQWNGCRSSFDVFFTLRKRLSVCR